MAEVDRNTIWCSFCGRRWPDAGPMAEGPGPIYICGPCCVAALRIIDDELAKAASERGASAPPNPLN